jgi:hypothetical protein
MESNSAGLALIIALLASSPSAQAAGKHVKALVLELPPDPAFKPGTMQTFNEFLAGATRDQGLEVITPANVAAVLGAERQRQLLGCTESGCLAEIGGALGVDYIVRGVLAQLEDSAALSLALVDTRGRTTNEVRTLIRSKSSTDVLQAIERLVPELIRPLQGLLVEARPAVSAPAGGLVSSQQTTGSGPSTRHLLLGGGVAGVVVAAGLGTLSVLSARGLQSEAATGIDNHEAANRVALEGRVALGLGVVGAGLLLAGMLTDGGGSPEVTQ